jgi:hypothetical protein
MKKLSLLLVATAFSTSILAQTIPVLAKEWNGRVAVTSMGSVGKHNPKDATNVGKDKAAIGWNAYSAQRSLIIVRQVDQHIEAIWRTAKDDTPLVGTISFDGKQLQLSGKNKLFLLNIEGNKMFGCGTTRGEGGHFGHWFDNYSTHCTEFIAVK